MPRAVLEAPDVSAVTQLILRERFSRDLGLWEQMHNCFHDDSVVRISWINASGPEFVRRSKEMAERNVNASHRLGREALATPGRPGVRVIAKRFGVDPGTVQRISRPFAAVSVVAVV